MAERIGLSVADKPDSQDICFVPDGDYASYIIRSIEAGGCQNCVCCMKDGVCRDASGKGAEDKICPRIAPGNFVLTDGTVIGRHKGIIHYTVGQRKGLGLALGYPVFVLEIRPETNEVVVGTNEESLSYEVRADRVNFMSVADLTGKKRVWAKIRYNHRGAWCTVEKTGEDELRCVFEEPQRAVTCGQAVVLYDEDHVLGGGTII